MGSYLPGRQAGCLAGPAMAKQLAQRHVCLPAYMHSRHMTSEHRLQSSLPPLAMRMPAASSVSDLCMLHLMQAFRTRCVYPAR